MVTRGEEKIMVPQPQVFADANKEMGGVDKIDQLNFHSCIRRNNRQFPFLNEKDQYQYVVNLLTYRRTTSPSLIFSQ